MANGFVVAKLQSHILHTSTKIKSVSLTSRRKYKTNSSSSASLKILNKILGKTLQNTLGVEVIVKCVRDYPCFTTKPFFTECTGRRHHKLGPNAPHSKFHFNDSVADRFKDNLEIEKSENKSTYSDIGSKYSRIEYDKVKTKFQEAYFTKCIAHRHQKPDSNGLDPGYPNLQKDSATDQIEATYFSDKNNFKPAYLDIGSKVHTIQYINKVKQAKFQKPYFTKCPGHYRHKPGSNASDSFSLYSIPSKNPATDLTKAIYLSYKDKLVIDVSKNKSEYFNNGSKIRTTENNKSKAKFRKAYFTKYIGRRYQKPDSNAPQPMYPNPLNDPATDPIEATYFSDKDNLVMEEYENKPAYIDIGTKGQRIEYNKVKAKFQSPYFTKRTGLYRQNLSSKAESMFSLYPIPSLTPIPDRNKVIPLSKENIENKSVSKVQRIEYNKVKAKYVENEIENSYALKSVERMHIIPKMPEPEANLDDMIESQLKYNKVRPRNPKHVNLDSDPKDSQSTEL